MALIVPNQQYRLPWHGNSQLRTGLAVGFSFALQLLVPGAKGFDKDKLFSLFVLIAAGASYISSGAYNLKASEQKATPSHPGTSQVPRVVIPPNDIFLSEASSVPDSTNGPKLVEHVINGGGERDFHLPGGGEGSSSGGSSSSGSADQTSNQGNNGGRGQGTAGAAGGDPPPPNRQDLRRSERIARRAPTPAPILELPKQRRLVKVKEEEGSPPPPPPPPPPALVNALGENDGPGRDIIFPFSLGAILAAIVLLFAIRRAKRMGREQIAKDVKRRKFNCRNREVTSLDIYDQRHLQPANIGKPKANPVRGRVTSLDLYDQHLQLANTSKPKVNPVQREVTSLDLYDLFSPANLNRPGKVAPICPNIEFQLGTTIDTQWTVHGITGNSTTLPTNDRAVRILDKLPFSDWEVRSTPPKDVRSTRAERYLSDMYMYCILSMAFTIGITLATRVVFYCCGWELDDPLDDWVDQPFARAPLPPRVVVPDRNRRGEQEEPVVRERVGVENVPRVELRPAANMMAPVPATPVAVEVATAAGRTGDLVINTQESTVETGHNDKVFMQGVVAEAVQVVGTSDVAAVQAAIDANSDEETFYSAMTSFARAAAVDAKTEEEQTTAAARAVLTDAETVINAVDEKKKEEANEACVAISFIIEVGQSEPHVVSDAEAALVAVPGFRRQRARPKKKAKQTVVAVEEDVIQERTVLANINVGRIAAVRNRSVCSNITGPSEKPVLLAASEKRRRRSRPTKRLDRAADKNR